MSTLTRAANALKQAADDQGNHAIMTFTPEGHVLAFISADEPEPVAAAMQIAAAIIQRREEQNK